MTTARLTRPAEAMPCPSRAASRSGKVGARPATPPITPKIKQARDDHRPTAPPVGERSDDGGDEHSGERPCRDHQTRHRPRPRRMTSRSPGSDAMMRVLAMRPTTVIAYTAGNEGAPGGGAAGSSTPAGVVTPSPGGNPVRHGRAGGPRPSPSSGPERPAPRRSPGMGTHRTALPRSAVRSAPEPGIRLERKGWKCNQKDRTPISSLGLGGTGGGEPRGEPHPERGPETLFDRVVHRPHDPIEGVVIDFGRRPLPDEVDPIFGADGERQPVQLQVAAQAAARRRRHGSPRGREGRSSRSGGCVRAR